MHSAFLLLVVIVLVVLSSVGIGSPRCPIRDDYTIFTHNQNHSNSLAVKIPDRFRTFSPEWLKLPVHCLFHLLGNYKILFQKHALCVCELETSEDESAGASSVVVIFCHVEQSGILQSE